MKVIDTFVNTTKVPITRTYTKQIGTTITATNSASMKAGISATIGAKVSGGVEGIASAEASSELTTYMEGITSFSNTESSTTMIVDETEYVVNPGRKFTMWQLCVSDAKDKTDPNLFELQSRHVKISSEAA